MILEEAKKLLSDNGISFIQTEYDSETNYLKHITILQSAVSPRKVTALVIQSKNAKRNLELQFNLTDNKFVFEDLWFGGFCYELYMYDGETLKNKLLSIISQIMEGNVFAILAYNLKKNSWVAQSSFYFYPGGDFRNLQYEKAIRKIEKKKTFFDKFFKRKIQYEIYDWNTHSLVIK